jgi:Na+-translocating ferredoxin:NAD+ oxidoreductase RnfG subunit
MKKYLIILISTILIATLSLTSCEITKEPEKEDFSDLLAVMPKGSHFNEYSLIYYNENTFASSLKNIPESIISIFKENNDIGFAVRVNANTNFSESPMEITVGVTTDGKICGIQINSYGDDSTSNWNNKLTDSYLNEYIGQDSGLEDICIISGATQSSLSLKNAISDVFYALVENDLVKAGDTDFRFFENLIFEVYTSLSNLHEISASGNIKKAYKSKCDTGFAYIITDGETNYLALVNAMGVCKIYDTKGNLIDNDAIAAEAKAHAATSQKSYTIELINTTNKLVSGASDYNAITLDMMSSIVSAITFQINGNTYYAFHSRINGFELMDIYIILDANGAIVKVYTKKIIFYEEYFYGFSGVIPEDYLDGFSGVTGNTWIGDEALITGATMTSDAMKKAVTDAFAAFDSLTKK